MILFSVTKILITTGLTIPTYENYKMKKKRNSFPSVTEEFFTKSFNLISSAKSMKMWVINLNIVLWEHCAVDRYAVDNCIGQNCGQLWMRTMVYRSGWWAAAAWRPGASMKAGPPAQHRCCLPSALPHNTGCSLQHTTRCSLCRSALHTSGPLTDILHTAHNGVSKQG